MERFDLVCGSDDFLVQRAGAELWGKITATAADPFSCEIISGFAGTVSEAESAVARFREAVETLDLLGNRKSLWLRDVNFLGDTTLGRTQGAKAAAEALQEVLLQVTPETVAVLVTAAPIDRRTTLFKALSGASRLLFLGAVEGDAAGAASASLAAEEAKRLGASIEPDALRLLAERTEGSTRILLQEVAKLVAFSGDGKVTLAMVEEITPNFAEGDFFEAADAFFRRRVPEALDAITRHFFTGGDARPLLTSFQNRCRLLLQLRALTDAKLLPERGINKAALERVGERFAGAFEGVTEKSGFNIASQHPFYLAQLADSAKLFSVPELLSLQLDLVRVFRRINQPGEDAEAVLRDLTLRHLAKEGRSTR